MSEILSQREIDELLSTLSGETPEKIQTESYLGDRRIKNYDFRSPKKLTKEQLKILQGIYENFARYLASYFSGILRFYCQVELLSIEEQPYYEYNNSLPDSILIGVIDAKPIEGSILVDISNSVTFTLVERLLGGNGKTIAPKREFTEIEISLMERVFRQLSVFTKDAWVGFLNVEASLQQIETNPRLIQSMTMDQIVVIIVLDVTIGSVKGTINFCIPCINIETLIDQHNLERYHSKRAFDAAQDKILRESMESHIKVAPLELRCMLGETMLTLQDIIGLHKGDVIKFDQAANSEVTISVGEKPWFYGTPGIKRNKKAIKVSKVL